MFSIGETIHNAAITQIDSIGRGEKQILATAVSQFFSIDSSETVALWITAAVDTAGSSADSDVKREFDYSVSPWSTLKLIPSHILRPQSNMPIWLSMFPVAYSPTASIVYGDTSTILLGTSTGEIKKISRFGNPSTPVSLSSYFAETVEVELKPSSRVANTTNLDVPYTGA